MSKIKHHFDRRRQPQASIQAIGEALAEINWQVREITSHRFILPDKDWTNESFGYELTVPKQMPIKGLWVGFIKHVKAAPGIYAGLTPDMCRDRQSQALRNGYRISDFDFGKHILLKQIVNRDKLQEMEENFGTKELKDKMKEILRKNYPFSEKK